MTDTTRPRAGSDFALKSHKSMWKRLMTWLRPEPKGLHIDRLDAHLARDIGLSESELERYQLTLPSQTTYHPRG